MQCINILGYFYAVHRHLIREKFRNIDLDSGSLKRISLSCSEKPISKSLSASSKTTYSTLANFNSISTSRWSSRPGVATMLFGTQSNKKSLLRHSVDVHSS